MKPKSKGLMVRRCFREGTLLLWLACFLSLTSFVDDPRGNRAFSLNVSVNDNRTISSHAAGMSYATGNQEPRRQHFTGSTADDLTVMKARG